MKKIFGFALVALCVLVAFTGSLTSCTKTVTNTVHDTVIQIKTDTLREKDTLLTAAILMANSWKLQVTRGNYGNNFVYYLRGGSSNTQNFDNEYITFNPNNTGVYTDNSGGQSTFTWAFSDATNTKLVWTWNLPSPVIVTWDHIVYDDGAIRYTEFYSQFGNNYVADETRIPK